MRILSERSYTLLEEERDRAYRRATTAEDESYQPKNRIKELEAIVTSMAESLTKVKGNLQQVILLAGLNGLEIRIEPAKPARTIPGKPETFVARKIERGR